MIQDIMMKPVHDIIQHYHHWMGTHPIPPARLTILILRKAYPTSGIYFADS
jgi:hypothetical protein